VREPGALGRRQLVTALAALGLALGMAGCGGVSAAPTATALTRHWPPVLAAGPTTPPHILKPIGWLATPVSATHAVLRTPLTGHGSDTVDLTVSALGHGTVTVYGPRRTILLEVPHGGGVIVLDYGRQHLPVLVVAASPDYCGTGGCLYTGYTWVARSHRFEPIPSALVGAYRYSARTRQFRPTMVGVEGAGLFGFGQPGHLGLVLMDRLYDAWQHVMVQRIAYAAAPPPTGEWRPVGPITYAPTGPMPTVARSLGTPALAYAAFVDVRCLDLVGQGRELLAPGAMTAWTRLRPLARLGMTWSLVAANPTVVRHGRTFVVSDTVVGTAGEGARETLHAYRVTVEIAARHPSYVVIGAHLAPLPLKVASLKAVLQVIRLNPVLRHMLVAKKAPIVVQGAMGVAWQVLWVQHGSLATWITVNAETGRVVPAQ
jgi:hypothetical protein